MNDEADKLKGMLQSSLSELDSAGLDAGNEIRQRSLQMIFFLTALRGQWKEQSIEEIEESLEIVGALAVEIGQLAGYEGDDMIRDFQLLAPLSGETQN